MKIVEDNEILICNNGINAGKVYTVISTTPEIFVLAETYFDEDTEHYITDINHIKAYCNNDKRCNLKSLGFSKIYPRLY